jgi:AGCS family alanine or glycine:cation symporter
MAVATPAMFPIPTVADQFRQDLHIYTWVTGLVMAVLVALVIIGGIKRIGVVTSKLVPFMAVLYLTGGFLVLLMNAGEVIPSLVVIVQSAFEPAAKLGGFAGGTFIFMLTWGVKRGLFSNESGQGSAPIAHAAAKTDEPVREGVVAMLGPFIDTLIICTMTGLVILTTGVWKEKQHQHVVLNEQADVQAVVAGTLVEVNGDVPEDALCEGRLRVSLGVPKGFTLVRNHGTVDEAVLLYSPNKVKHGEAEPFTGYVEMEWEDPGNIALGKILDRNQRPVEGVLIMEGWAMQNGSPLTSWAFQRGLGKLAGGYGHLLVTVAVFLFGVSTAISWSYYGDRSIQYLLGDRAILPYKFVFCVMHFMGAVYPLEVVWSFGDTALGLMSFPNLLAILLLTGQVRKMTKEYEAKGGLLPPGKG